MRMGELREVTFAEKLEFNYLGSAQGHCKDTVKDMEKC